MSRAAKLHLGNLDYPTGDGKPMAETPIHMEAMILAREQLLRHFEGNDDVYIGSNMMMFYEEGNKRRHVAPDVFVVRGVPKEPQRPNYIVWQEGKGPDFVLEVTSKSTKKEDLKTKFDLFRDVLHVAEYFLFDPNEEYLKPSMKGFQLIDGEYVPIEAVNGRFASEVLGVDLARQGKVLRLVDRETGQFVPLNMEIAEREAERANRETARADALAAEISALRARLHQAGLNGHNGHS